MTGRIWILANQGEVGGGEVMLHHIATALRELGRDVAVVAPAHPAEAADRLAADGFDVVRVGGPGRLAYMRALRAWDRGRGGDDVVWCNGLLPATALAGRARRIVHLHQVPEKPLLRVFSALARPGALAVLAPSRFAADRIRWARVLPNWVPAPAVPARTAAEPGAPLRVGFLGRLSEDKGIVTFLRATQSLRAAAPGRFAFSVAGEARFVKDRERRAVEEAFRLAGPTVGRLGWQDTAAFLGSIDVLAVPSQWAEVFGLVAAEAMAAGVPVVVSDAGALPEVVGPDHPLTFHAGDDRALAHALQTAARADLTAIAAAQHARWQDLFSPEAGRAHVAALLDDLGI